MVRFFPRFSLRTLLIAVVLCALGAWGVRTFRLSKMYKIGPQVEVTKWVIVGSDSRSRDRKQIEYLYRVEHFKSERFIDREPFGSIDEVIVTSRGRISHYFSAQRSHDFSAQHSHVDSVGERQISTTLRNRFAAIQNIAEGRCNLDHIVWRRSVETGWNPSPIMQTSIAFGLTPAEVKHIKGASTNKLAERKPGK